MNSVDYQGPNGFEVRGFTDLVKNLDELGEEVSKFKTNRIWKNIAQNSLLPVLATARQIAPVRTGQLRAHINIASQKAKSRDFESRYISSDTGYIGRVTSGAKRDTDRLKTIAKATKAGRVRFFKYRSSRPIPFWQEYGTDRNDPKLYLRKALEGNYEAVIERAEYEIREALKQVAAWGDPK